MAAPLNSDWRRSYSWWWDSHSHSRITPNNSKWLHHSLTDMDGKIEAMIKLIEEDADSFARRAEMFYEKRPELMKLIEDFYRAYRALAERYDHATGELRQAHKIISQAFPDQISSLLLTDDDDSPCKTSPPKQAVAAETEMENLKKALAEMQIDKEGVLLNYQNTMKRLSDMDEEISCAQMNSVLLNELASEAQKLKEELVKVEAERDDCLEEKHSLAREESARLKENAERAENEVRNMEMALAELNKEKDEAAIQYRNCLEKIKKLEDELEGSNQSVQLEVDDLPKISMKKGEDLEQKNYSLLLECQKYIEASKLAEKLINDLECENLEQQVEGEILLDEIEKMRLDMLKVFRALEVDVKDESEFSFLRVLERIEDLKFSLVTCEDRSQHLSVENAVLLGLLDGRKENLNLQTMVRNEAVKQLKNNLEMGEKHEEEEEDSFEMWDAEATTFYFDFHLSNVREVLYKSKVHELSESCEALEKETVSKTMEIERIKERFVSMESEIGDLKAQLSACAPIIDSLRNNIVSLEHIVLKDAYLELHPSKEKNNPKDVSNLQKLQFRVEAVIRVLQTNEMTKPEILESIDDDLTKDIPLDQISNSCSLRRTNNNNNIVGRNHPRADDQMLALWEAAAEDSNFIHADASVPWDLKTEITETLAIDTEKLMKLKTTMVELRNKMKKLKKKKKNSFDFETIKEQFQEVDEAIVQFTCMNDQLKRNIKELIPSRSQTGMKQVYELARNGSEGITRLEVEVQKIQYVLLKHDEEKKKKKPCLCRCFNPSSPTTSPLSRLACDAHIVSGAVEWL